MSHDELRALAEAATPYERRNSDGAGGIALDAEGIQRSYSRPSSTTLLGWLYPPGFTKAEVIALLDEIDALRAALQRQARWHESHDKAFAAVARQRDRYREALERIGHYGDLDAIKLAASRALSETGERKNA